MAQDFSIKNNRNLNNALDGLSRTFERLSSGSNFNRASDNPAARAILSQLEANDKGRGQAGRNIDDAVSLSNIQDGALAQVTEITGRLSELSIQAANGTLSDSQRQTLNAEYTSLTQEIGRIAESTEFNGQKVFSGSSTTIQSGIGNDAGSQFSLSAIDISALASAVQSSSIDSASNAQSSIAAIETFRSGINQAVGTLGAAQSSLSRLSEVNSSQRVNEADAASRIRDVDYASASADRLKFQILAQSSLATAAQINKIQPNIAAALLS